MLRLAGAVLVCFVVFQMFKTVQARIESVGRVPVRSALDFVDSLGLDPEQPVVASPHWIYAKAGQNLQSVFVLRDTGKSTFDFPAELREAVPRYKPLADVPTLILDDAAEVAILQSSLNHAHRLEQTNEIAEGRSGVMPWHWKAMIEKRHPELVGDQAIAKAILSTNPVGMDELGKGFLAHAVFLHSGNVTGTHTVFTRSEPTPWPMFGIATSSGPSRLTFGCHTQMPIDGTLTNESGLWVARMPLRAPATAKDAMLVRIVMAHPVGVAIVAQDQLYADLALTAIRARGVPYRIAIASLAFRLSTGEPGRDLILPVNRLREAILIVASTSENRIDRIEIGTQC